MARPLAARPAASPPGPGAGGAKAVKIVVTGPFAAGKTTLIRTISDSGILATDRVVSDETKAVKEQTTVAMDFGRLSFGDDLSLHLFGTPGQRRFEVMWEILAEGMIGFILLVNASEPRAGEEAAHILASFRRLSDAPFAVGVSHLDEVGTPPEVVLAGLRVALGLHPGAHLLPCDPRSREDVKTLLLSVLGRVLGRLDAQAAG